MFRCSCRAEHSQERSRQRDKGWQSACHKTHNDVQILKGVCQGKGVPGSLSAQGLADRQARSSCTLWTDLSHSAQHPILGTFHCMCQCLHSIHPPAKESFKAYDMKSSSVPSHPKLVDTNGFLSRFLTDCDLQVVNAPVCISLGISLEMLCHSGVSPTCLRANVPIYTELQIPAHKTAMHMSEASKQMNIPSEIQQTLARG